VDELERVFRRLVREVGPGAATEWRAPLTVAGVREVLESPAATPIDPDVRAQLLLRLLAGERGYLSADRDVQERAASTLHGNATPGGVLAAFGERHVALGTDATRRALSAPSAAPAATAAARPAQAVARRGVVARPAPATAGASATSLAPATRAPARTADRARAPHASRDCHYCGSVLPRLRTLTYCPQCGQNLTVRHCPACSAEVDVTWKFCVACGRECGSG
jgi:hypothetical protein